MKDRVLVKELAPNAFQVEAQGPSRYRDGWMLRGRIWHGVFASEARALSWGNARALGLPYNPIPKAGEV